MQNLLFDVAPEESGHNVIERMIRPRNITEAYRRVRSNGGAPGVDGMTVHELKSYLAIELPKIEKQLQQGTYQPKPVRRVEIPKAGGGTRGLGIPTVLDRLLQQALLQILDPLFDPSFSSSSFGFRRGRSCHDAVRQAQQYIKSGNRWVVDLDLEKFFDRVNHDILMDRVSRKVKDKMALRLIRSYLESGVLEGGLATQSVQGTPQGGPLSPLLSNVLLNDWDKELERRGHKFCRYADDCNIYVKSREAGDRVMKSLTDFLSVKLRLTVNQKKSAVERPWNRVFLGFSFLREKGAKIRMAPDREKRMRAKVRPILRAGRGRKVEHSLKILAPLIRGWAGYFLISEVKSAFERFDEWLRRRIRAIYWRQWKRPRKRAQMLQKLGIDRNRARKSASNGRGPWWNSAASHMNQAITTRRLRLSGYVSILEESQRLKRFV